MFKNHETCNDICCPEYDRKGTIKDDSKYWKNYRSKHSKEGTEKYYKKSYSSEDGEYCSCTSSDLDEFRGKPIAKNRQSTRGETSKLATRGKLREKRAKNGISILQNGKSSSIRRKHDKFTKQTEKGTRKSENSWKFVECTPFSTLRSGKNYSGHDRAKQPEIGSKYRSKSLGAKVNSSVAAAIHKNGTKKRSKVEKSMNVDEKPRKTERRYSRRDVKKADGVTEVTSLEIVKNWSREALPPTANIRKPKNLKNTRWPSRKSTKVIFARYSQESMDGNHSERSTSLDDRDWSDEETCVCDDDETKTFDADYNIEDFSSECVDFVDESMIKSPMPFFDEKQVLRKKDSCICYDCPLRGKRVENKLDRASRQDRDVELDRRIKVGRGWSLDRDAANRGTRLQATEKLISDVVGLNNKYSSQKTKLNERKASLGRIGVTRDPDVRAQFSGQQENFSRQNDREKRKKKTEVKTRKKRIMSKVVSRKIPEQYPEETAEQNRKLCKIFNTRETKNMMNCCCMASQLEEDHGCSVDCRCPESFLMNWSENLEIPKCPIACSPEGYLNANRSALKNESKKFSRQQSCCIGQKKALRTTDAGYKKINDQSRLSRIGYVEECEDEYDTESSDGTLTERNFHKDDGQPCENSCCPSPGEGSAICFCPEQESKLKGRKKFEAGEPSGCDECLNLEDLCPEVPLPDHWTKYGGHLNRVTDEYRTLSSRLRDMQREAKMPETSGRVRKRISRKYPSGKEFSFEVKTVNDSYDDDCGIGKTLDEDCDHSVCQCEEPLDDPSTTWRDTSHFPGRTGSPDHCLRTEKTARDRSTRRMSADDFIPCDCPTLEKKKKRKRWKVASEETDLVKTLESFCAKVKAIDRELESSILTKEDKKNRDKFPAENCECDESEDDVEESELSCEKYCDACVGTNGARKFERQTSEDISMAPRIVKPCGASRKTNLKKIFIYPPDGEDGPPLTLEKNTSDIKCTIVSDVKNRFRYKVTYTQQFMSPAWCPVDECCGGQDSDEYQNTDDYG